MKSSSFSNQPCSPNNDEWEIHTVCDNSDVTLGITCISILETDQGSASIEIFVNAGEVMTLFKGQCDAILGSPEIFKATSNLA